MQTGKKGQAAKIRPFSSKEQKLLKNLISFESSCTKEESLDVIKKKRILIDYHSPKEEELTGENSNSESVKVK